MAEWLTRREVAALFRVNPKTVTRWEESGKLKVRVQRTLGGHRRYNREDLEGVLQERVNDHRQ